MTGEAVYLPAAEDDIAAAHAAYEAESPGLGDRFARAVRDRADTVAEMPALFGEVAAGVRAAPVRKFPHVIYYRVEGGRVVVIAVTHGRRLHHGWEERA